MSMQERLSTGLVWLVALCALAVTASTFWPKGSGATTPEMAPRALGAEQWARLRESGHLLVAARARPAADIVYFTDYECPYCNKFERASLQGALAEFPGRITVRLRHWPLPSHKLAYPSARAIECAYSQQHLLEYHAVITSKADSIGIIPFVAMAVAAGVPDTSQFQECMGQSGPLSAIEQDVAAAKSLAGLGTPLIIINGTLYPAAPDSATFVNAVRKAVQGS